MTSSEPAASSPPEDTRLRDLISAIGDWTTRLLSVLRIVSAFLFVEHGLQKWLAFPVPRASPTILWSLSGVAGVFEFVGGALLLLGLFTRPVAFALSGLMAFAYFIAHAPRGFWPIVNGGELAALVTAWRSGPCDPCPARPATAYARSRCRRP